MVAVTPPRVLVNGSQLDPAAVVLPLEIRHGRSNPATQPDAPSCQFTYRGAVLPFEMGADVVVMLDLPSMVGSAVTWDDPIASWVEPTVDWLGNQLTEMVRFTGRVVAITAREARGDVDSWLIGALGTQNLLGSVNIRTDRPQETDAERVAAIGALAGQTINVVGANTVTLLPDSINRDALSALHEVCSWTGGMLFNGRDGAMYYGTADHRDTNPQATIPAGAVLDGVQWDTTAADILNHIVVTYGDPETQRTYQDAESIAKWGFRHVEIGTQLENETDANEFGNTVLLRRKDPFWVMPGIVCRSDVLTTAEFWEINTLAVSMGVLVPVPVEPGPVGGYPDVWTAEGWIETWDTAGVQRLQIAVTDRARWGAYQLVRWSGMAGNTFAYYVPFTFLQAMTGDTELRNP